MITVRKSQGRGHVQYDWLNTFHTFSFGEYYDPNHIHFRTLRVINEDYVKPSSGFPFHSHKDMEIITYIISGSIEHQDSLGNKAAIKRGEIQLMRAGSGITHSEHNTSATEELHLLQIWIFPNEKSLKPGYQQKSFNILNKSNELILVASSTGENNSFSIAQDVKMYASSINNHNLNYNVMDNRHVWIQVISGNLTINNINLTAGDGAAISNEKQLMISGSSEFILFDLA